MHEKRIAHHAGLGALLLCLGLAVSAPVAQAQEAARPGKRKTPGVAWGLSFVYAGLGQAYNGEWGRAVAFAAPATIGWALYWNSWEGCVVNHTNCATRNISVAMIMGAWIGSQIDAPLRASAINRNRNLGPSRKTPWVAWGLSYLVPGLGQVYNGDWGRAAGFAVTATAGSVLFLNNWEDCHDNHTNCTTRNIGFAMSLAAWIGSQIDAPLRARAINRKRGLSFEVGPALSPGGLSLARIRF